MDNSLATYKRKVEEMIREMEKFSSALNHHVIIAPKETIQDAVRAGFPSDIASYYLQQYYSRNESDAQDIMRYIKSDCIPYLSDVAFYVESAMNIGSPIVRDQGIDHLTIGSKPRILDTGNIGSNQGHIPPPIIRSPEELAHSMNQLIKRDEIFQRHDLKLEKALGIKRGAPMSIAEADKQNANPNYRPKYIEDPYGLFYLYNNEVYDFKDLPSEARNNLASLQRCSKNPDYIRMYAVNCATCAIAYVLRLRGFDVKAKGNPEIKGNLNTWLSECHSFDVWENEDGTPAVPTLYKEWMKENGITEMSPADYREFFEKSCKDVGVYIVTVAWKGDEKRDYKGAHATILQRDKDGKLYYIEPQVYNSARTQDGRRNIDDLIEKMAPMQPLEKGVMRVDNKLFKTEYAELFEA